MSWRVLDGDGMEGSELPDGRFWTRGRMVLDDEMEGSIR